MAMAAGARDEGNDGEKRTHDEVGDKQTPFELIPTSLGSCSTTLLGTEYVHTVVIVVTIAGHAGLIAAKSLASTALLG